MTNGERQPDSPVISCEQARPLFLTVSDNYFFPGTLAGVNSILHFYPAAEIVVVNNDRDKVGLTARQTAMLEAGGVRVVNAETLSRPGRKLAAWELKAYAAADLTDGYDVLIGIDSDCLLCGPIDDVIASALRTGRFHGGHDGRQVYDAGYAVYGIQTPAVNEKYMSASLYVCRLDEANRRVLRRWAACCAEAVFGGGKVYPGHGDQGVLNAVIFEQLGPGGVELLDNHLWSQHWQYWKDEIMLEGGRLVNRTIGRRQRALHSGGPHGASEKFWARGHVERLTRFPAQITNYAWFLAFLRFGRCSDETVETGECLGDESKHLSSDVQRFGDAVRQTCAALGLDSSALKANDATRRGAPVRKLLLRNSLCPGDILMLTAAVRDLHLTHPGKFLTDVRTTCAAFWEHNPYLTPLDEGDADVEQITCEYPLIHQSNRLPYHFIHGFRLFLEEKLGVRIEPHAFKGDVHLSAREKRWMSQVEESEGVGARFWIIVSGGKHDYTAKWWDPERAQQVVDHFQGRLRFVQCGEQHHEHPRLRNVIDLVGKTDLRQMVRLMYHADGVICPVTMFMHLAAAVETKPGRPPNRPCVVIAGGREPAQWEAYPHHQYLHTNGALPCCADGGCWKSRVAPLGDGDAKDESLCLRPRRSAGGRTLPQCLDLITAGDVINAVEKYLLYDASPRGATCPDCVSPADEDERFCGACGARLEPMPLVTAAAEPELVGAR